MKREMKLTWEKIVLYLFIVMSMGGLFSCEEEGAEFVSDLDVVVTRFDEAFDFAATKTYLMPDTIVHIPPDENYTERDSAFHAAILERVAQNMETLGYQRVTEGGEATEAPDLVLTLTILDRNYYHAYGWGPDLWYGYWGYYNWGYWGYSWIGPGWYAHYPGYWSGYAYSTGSLVLDLMQPQENGNEEQIPVVWNGIFKGIYSFGLSQRMLRGVDQMFEQSPYLSVK